MSDATASTPSTPDLYRVLGVPRRASADRIRAAYRRKAKQYHPDHNPGDEATTARFRLVQLAYDVLSDPDRRARYDATGDTADARPVNPHADVMSVLAPMLFGVIEQVVKQGGEVTAEDMLAHMRTMLRGAAEQFATIRRDLAKRQAAAEKVAERFKVKGGEENLLAIAAKSHARDLERQARQVEAEEAKVKKATEYLASAGCSYERVKKLVHGYAKMGGLFNGTASTHTATWGRY